jgi:hypothetical protein
MQTQMAGYVTTYNKPVGTQGSFLFTTVRGAGHMVPRYRPAVTSQFTLRFQMISYNWLI